MAWGWSAGAQGLCDDLQTISECRISLRTRLSGENPDSPKQAVAASQDSVKKKTETGLSDLPTGLSSSVKDFLPLLQLSGILGNVKTDDDTGVVTVALNTRFIGNGRLTEDNAFQLKALIETKPKLFDPIKQGLPTANRDALQKELLDEPNRQNVTLQASTNLTTKRLGRNFNQYRHLLDDLFAEIVNQKSKTFASEAEQIALDIKLTALTSGLLENSTRMRDIPADGNKTREQRREEIEDALLRSVEHGLGLRTTFVDEVKSSGIFLFGQLVNNQPQLHFTVARAFRDPLFGPQQWSGRVSYERGLGNNVNAFLDSAGAACQTHSSPACVKALKAFTASAKTKAAIKAGARFAVYAEFTTNDEYAYQLAAQKINLAFDSGWKTSFGADFGRLIGVEDDGTASARVDGSVKGDFSSDDTLSRNRVVASITLTKKFGDISVPFGLRYASRTEFLSDFDHGISANVGLKFNLFPGIK
jgi:hypothetical protein